MFASPVQWGDVGTWVAGLATAAAFFVTASVFTMQLRDRRREDARQVSAWINLRHLRSEPPQYEVKCRNGSAEPIFSVAVVLGDLHQGKGVIVNVIGPKSTTKTRITAPNPTTGGQGPQPGRCRPTVTHSVYRLGRKALGPSIGWSAHSSTLLAQAPRISAPAKAYGVGKGSTERIGRSRAPGRIICT